MQRVVALAAISGAGPRSRATSSHLKQALIHLRPLVEVHQVEEQRDTDHNYNVSEQRIQFSPLAGTVGRGKRSLGRDETLTPMSHRTQTATNARIILSRTGKSLLMHSLDTVEESSDRNLQGARTVI